MGSIYKWALACFFLFLYQHSYNQCLNSKPITTTRGDTVVYLCPGGKKTEVSIKQFTYGIPFATVVTNTHNIALKVANSSVIDLADLPEGDYRIYGYSYKGFLNNIIGKNIFIHQLTSYCYTRSSNFIRVVKTPPAAPILDAQSFYPSFVCGPDQKYDSIKVNAQFPTSNSKAYIVVNEQNKIVLISNAALINADPLDCKICKVYAVGYSGNIIAKKGDDFNVALADDCYSTSKNFITFNHDLPIGGTITLNGEASNQFICSDSKKDHLLSMNVIGNKAGLVMYIITDSTDRILEIKNEPKLSSVSLQAGVCKIFGLTYTGNIEQKLVGKKITSTALSDDCYALTANAILIAKKRPYAGELSVSTSVNKFCLGDTLTELNIGRNNTIGGQQKWIVSDEFGIIERIIDSKLIPGSWLRGRKKIYNLSFTGNLMVKPGSKITDPYSDDCFDLSVSFISVLIDNPNPGNLSFSNSSSNLFVCASDTPSMKIQFMQTGNNSFKQLFVLTDQGGIVVSVRDSNKIDFVNLKNGFYRVYSVSFNGNLNYNIGEPIGSIKSDQCHTVSERFLSIIKGEAKAGIVEFEGEQDTLLVCLESNYQKVKLKNKTATTGKQMLIVSDAKATVIGIHSDSVDLRHFPKGIYKIQALAYTDSFKLLQGAPLSALQPDKGCIDLGTKVLIAIVDKTESGTIRLKNEDTSYQICAKDGWPDLLLLQNTSDSKFPYTYVVTDTSNIILSINAVNTNLELLPTYHLRVYGVSFTGKIVNKPGEKLSQETFSTGCASITNKFIAISGTEVIAGTIRTHTNTNQLFYCLNSKVVDTIRLSNNGASSKSKYVYIGIHLDTLRFVSNTGIILNTDLPAGSTQVFGLAYKGNFEGKPGDKLSTKRLVDSCFGISTNSITINKENPEAGFIKAGEEDKIFLCPRDGLSDHISFSNVGSSALSYAYLIVNASDSIIDVSTDAIIDFDSYPTGTCRVFGISYKGKLNGIHKKIQAADLAEECFDITQNFISIIKSEANAGKVSLSNSDTAIQFCVEDLNMDTLRFKTSSNIKLNYVLLLTNTQDRIIYILDDLNRKYDFNGYDPGLYRVYGLSYGGVLTAGRNDHVKSSSLATNCFDLSDNFVLLQMSNSGGLCKNIGMNPENFSFISIYPNPAHGSLRVRLRASLIQSGKPELVLVSASGGSNRKIILNTQMPVNQEVEVNVQDITPGLYFLLFKNGYIFDRIKVMIIR